MDNSTLLATLPPPKTLEAWIRTRPGSFQLSLFGQYDEPTQLDVLLGSCVILTMEQLLALKSSLSWHHFPLSPGRPIRMGFVGYLNGARTYLTHLL